MMEDKPRAAMVTNQTIITGPKNFPMAAVPRFWEKKSKKRIMQVSGMMKGLEASVAISNPSMAERTEMAGVMIPSP